MAEEVRLRVHGTGALGLDFGEFHIACIAAADIEFPLLRVEVAGLRAAGRLVGEVRGKERAVQLQLGQGDRPRIWSWTCCAVRDQSTGESALDSMPA